MRVFRSFKSGFCGLELPMVSLADDQDNRWRNPSIKDAGDGHWEPDATGAPPTFGAGAHWDCDTDDEVEDLTSDAETAPLAATCSLGAWLRLNRGWAGILRLVTGMESNRLAIRPTPQRASSIRRDK